MAQQDRSPVVNCLLLLGGPALVLVVFTGMLWVSGSFKGDSANWEAGVGPVPPDAVVARVVSSQGYEPLPGATVELVKRDTGFSVAKATTDAGGVFRFTGLEEDTYDVVVTHPDHLEATMIVFAGKEPRSLRVTHRSGDPALMWAPDAPIGPAMETLLSEAVRQKQPWAEAYGELRKLHADYSKIESAEDDDEGGDYKRHAKYKRLREAVERDLVRVKEECVRGMIAHYAAETRAPALTRATEWIAKFRAVETAYVEAKERYDRAQEAKRRGEGTKADYDAAFQAWSTTGREWGRWKDEGGPILNDAKRALMAIRAAEEARKPR